MKSDLVDIEVEVKHETEAALLVSDGDNDIWLPLSQIEVGRTQGSLTTVTMPQWLAEEKGLV